MIPVDVSNWMRKSPRGLNPTQRIIGNRVKLGAGDLALSRKELTNYLFSAKQSAMKTYI